MKNLYLLALSCLMASAAQAQNLVPRPQDPGMTLQQQKGAARRAKRMQVPAKAEPLTVQQDTTLCVRRTTETDKGFTTWIDITYDKYGLRRLVTNTSKTGANSESSKTDRYTYEVSPAAIWTKRTLEQDYRPSGYQGDAQDWYVTDVVEREVDSEGRITLIRIENPNNSNVETRKFDYSHEYTDDRGNLRRGFEVETERKDAYSTRKEVYRWHEMAGQYLLESIADGYDHRTAVFHTDSVVTTTYQYDYDKGEWQPYYVTVDYYRVDGYPCEGSMSYYPLNEYGNNASGQRTITIATPDSVTWINQDYDDDTEMWVNRSKEVNYGGEDIWSTPFYLYKDYYFDEATGEWELSGFEQTELIVSTPKVAVIRYTDEDGTEYYANFFDEREEVEIETIGDNSFITREYGSAGTTYTRYDMDGNVLESYRTRSGFDSPVGWQNTSVYASGPLLCSVERQQPDGSWKMLSDYTFDTPDGNTVHVTFNAQGYPDKVTVCLSGNTTDILSEQTFTYTDKGYTVDERQEGGYILRRAFELLDDGWLSQIIYNYSPTDGTFSPATREDRWNDCKRTYSWNGETFTLSRVTAACPYRYYEDADTEVSINYEVSGNDVVPVSKEVDVDRSGKGFSESRRSTYLWDADAAEWVGKESNLRIFKHHDNLVVTYGNGDPLDNYYDNSSDFSVDDDEVVQAVPLTNFRVTYKWDAQAKQFVPDVFSGTYVEEDEANNAYTLYEGDNQSLISVTTYTRDTQGRATKVTRANLAADGTLTPFSSAALTYTPEGYWQSMTEITAGTGTVTNTYTYERRTITVTGIDELQPDATAELTIDGLTLSAPGQPLSLYDLQGARVAAGTGSVTAPRPGLYIIKVGSASVKAVLR